MGSEGHEAFKLRFKARVKLMHDLDIGNFSRRQGIEAFFHTLGIGIVQKAEVPAKRVHHDLAGFRWHQTAFFQTHVLPGQDVLQDSGISGRPPDTPFLQGLDQGRLGIPCRWFGSWTVTSPAPTVS